MRRVTSKNKNGQFTVLKRQGESSKELATKILNLAGKIEDMEEALDVDFVETFSGCEITDLTALQNLSELVSSGLLVKDYPGAVVLPVKNYIDRQDLEDGPRWVDGEVRNGWRMEGGSWMIRGYHLDEEIYEAFYGPLGDDIDDESVDVRGEVDKLMSMSSKVILVNSEHPVTDDRYGIMQELDPDFWSNVYIQMIGTEDGGGEDDEQTS